MSKSYFERVFESMGENDPPSSTPSQRPHDTGLTLFGFLRGTTMNIYTHPPPHHQRPYVDEPALAPINLWTGVRPVLPTAGNAFYD
ncbi:MULTISPECIES: hypothetical protein [Rhodococcus]|uniref:hypothetical protein n=1 Tax=Rhodococcus TaxID=1827 RepID=UPI00295597A7|nr:MULTISPECIES: hypothetical protein [Rhodococcus]MDV8106392.1 hypothetical protein [Rhodococcus sp. IEGM 69]MDV7242024.1 hypothetical protein [Rhodococcus oxybenzonivorans]MDV7278390.1 hypothetical protein [Rhodococcus oxybenzonivorans]MDV7337881.1 hypothetical protein [Rhodococcus oxybenzonivorans]MDV8027496.1 hypothetical protein [Rhodococcus sp. IEGM 27]